MNNNSILMKRSIQIIWIIWIISLIITLSILISHYLQYHSFKFTELVIFNGYALFFIVCLWIPSLIKRVYFEVDIDLAQYDSKTYVIYTAIQWMISFFATITIVLIYGIGNFSDNILIEFCSILFLFIIWAVIADLFVFFIAECFVYLITTIIAESMS
ncbi:MAG: hypothetical protein ACFFAO_17885 [Candidatus Hermodarchaeota archaeon]